MKVAKRVFKHRSKEQMIEINGMQCGLVKNEPQMQYLS